MRLPRAYLMNAVLLLVAGGSWAWFLYQSSTTQRRALERSGEELLALSLPPQASRIGLLLDRPGGEPIDVFPSLEGRTVGEREAKQIDAQIWLYTRLAMARRTEDASQWQRLGEVRITGGDGGSAALPIYRTPDSGFGFQLSGHRYKVSDLGAEGFLDFMYAMQGTNSP